MFLDSGVYSWMRTRRTSCDGVNGPGVFDRLFCIQFMRLMQFLGFPVNYKKQKPHRFFPWNTVRLGSIELLIFVSLLVSTRVVFMQFFCIWLF